MKTGFIFDLDGTLLNSPETGKYRIEVLLAINRIPFENGAKEKLFSQWGKPAIPMLIEVLGISEEKARDINTQWEIWDVVDSVPLFDGAYEVIEYCKRECGEIALFTSRHTENMKNVLRSLRVYDVFSLAVGLEGDAERSLFSESYKKENPASFLSIARYMSDKHNIDRFVYVGDTVFDVGHSLSAGIETLAVLSGGTSYEEFSKIINPENILSSVKEIPEWVSIYL